MEYQMSFFDEEPLSWFEENLQQGSGFQGGKIRLYAASLGMNLTDFTKYCKQEYGIGGWSIKDGFLNHDANGIELRIWKSDYKETYNWNQVAKSIKKLISIDRYLTDKEKEAINQIQDENDGTIPVPKLKTRTYEDEDE